MKAGLCTIAFKKKSVDEITGMAARAGADGIELWGQPSHVSYPIEYGELEKTAEKIRSAGMTVCAFGSYFRPGTEVVFDGEEVTPENQVEATRAVGAEIIRIWAGNKEYDIATAEEREIAYAGIREIADLAARHEITVVLERHSGTLTHGWAAPETVLKEIDHPRVFLNYQAVSPASAEELAERSVSDYYSLLPHSRHAHMNNRLETDDGTMERTLLDRGIIDYSDFGDAAAKAGFDGYCMLEFPAEIRGGMSVEESVEADIRYIKSL